MELEGLGDIPVPGLLGDVLNNSLLSDFVGDKKLGWGTRSTLGESRQLSVLRVGVANSKWLCL